MKTKTILAATLLMLVASTMPVNAYHITAPAANAWSLVIPLLVVCEHNGAPSPVPPHGGNGGLCTSGLNAVTCGVGCVPIFAPNPGDWSRFDLADSTGATSTVGYDVEIGAISCTVLPHQEVRYEESYVWWTFAYMASGRAIDHGHVAAYVDLTTSSHTSGYGVASPNATAGTSGCGTSTLAGGPVHLA